MSGLLQAIATHGATGRANPAFDDGRKEISWREAERFVTGAVAELERLDQERPIGVALEHSPASALLLVALLEAGIPAVPLPPYFTEGQRNAALDNAGAAAEITSCTIEGDVLRFTVEARACPASKLPEGTALISFSSGSTADPKGVCLSGSHLLTVAAAVCDHLGRESAGRHLPILPFGILLEQIAGLFASIIAGGTYVPLLGAEVGLQNPLRPDGHAMLDAVARMRATSLILVPEYLAVLVGAMEVSGRRLPRLNLVAVGGASVSPLLLERACALGLPVRQGYGMTEAGSVITLDDGAPSSVGSVGTSIGAHRLTIADDGEIVIEGPLFLGVVGKPRTPGPFATGDIGRVDENNRLWIDGRKSNLIVTSFGRNVSPEWVEGHLVAQPEIAQAMVRGDGQAALAALVVPSSPGAEVDAAVERANSALPPYARVGRHRVVPPFTPANGQLTGNGRLRRSAIDEAYQSEAQTSRFFDRLGDATREEQARFAATPQLVAGLTGQVSRADYIAYLTQAFHHVRHTVPLMREARGGLERRGNRMLVDALDEYIAEEIGHEEWILDDIAAAGGNPAVAVTSAPSASTRAMVDHAYAVIRNGNPAGFFGMVFVLEGTSIAMASNGAAAVQRRLGLPKSAFRYLYSHGSLDQDHMKFFERLMNRIEDPDDQAAIIAMAKDMFRLFGGLFAAIELEGVRSAA